MGRKYTFSDNSKMYFVTFTVIGWIDIFIRDEYRKIFYDSIKYSREHKGLEVYGYCLMTSHVHMIIGTETGNLSSIVGGLKSFISWSIRKELEAGDYESRKDWMLSMMKYAGENNKRNKDFQLWQQHNHPIELNSYERTIQRLNYIHKNPVAAGFVDNEVDWLHSSAGDYASIRKGKIELIFLS